MKRFFKRLICRIFGHKMYVEKYAERYYFKYKKGKGRGGHRYSVIESNVCERCGKRTVNDVRTNISRSQMLHDGWFIED